MAWIGVLFVLGFIVFKVIESISDGVSSAKQHSQNVQAFNEERSKKYGGRLIDRTVGLYQRNEDIIRQHEAKITATIGESVSWRRRSYHTDHTIDDAVRDCLNDIALAEGSMNVRPGAAFLSSWRDIANPEWVALSKSIETTFKNRRDDLAEKKREAALREQERIQEEREARDQEREKYRMLDRSVTKIGDALNARISKRKALVSTQLKPSKRTAQDVFVTSDLDTILSAQRGTWLEDRFISAEDIQSPKFPRIEPDIDYPSVKALNKKIDDFNTNLEAETHALSAKNKELESLRDRYVSCDKDAVTSVLDMIVGEIELPRSVPWDWNVDYDPDQKIAIIEVSLPDVVHLPVMKRVALKTSTVNKPLNQKEAKEFIPKIHPSIVLRTAYEVARQDNGAIQLLVVNGWVEYDDPATGNNVRTYTASLAAEPDKIRSLNLNKVDPLAAFLNLKGKSAGKLIDIVPVTPVMSLNKKDKRFIDTKEVLATLGAETNLASMDWQDFESLIAELFEKEFANEGAEIKVTQASRDRGVDAVIFNPDPIKGGKYIVQAKRYTNTVDVSAVRDLCAVVKKEGASKGILVTTSTYGADAYAFAQNEPITLLNGSELLGLLQKHGYDFRINLAEARKLASNQPATV